MLVTFETAKLAYEKGFRAAPKYLIDVYDREDGSLVLLKSILYYKNTSICYLAPTQEVLTKWLGDNHNIHVIPKPIFGSKCDYDSYPLIGWDADVISLNKNSTNCYYLGYPILDWYTATKDRLDEGDTLEDIHVIPNENKELAIEKGLMKALLLINI